MKFFIETENKSQKFIVSCDPNQKISDLCQQIAKSYISLFLTQSASYLNNNIELSRKKSMFVKVLAIKYQDYYLPKFEKISDLLPDSSTLTVTFTESKTIPDDDTQMTENHTKVNNANNPKEVIFIQPHEVQKISNNEVVDEEIEEEEARTSFVQEIDIDNNGMNDLLSPPPLTAAPIGFVEELRNNEHERLRKPSKDVKEMLEFLEKSINDETKRKEKSKNHSRVSFKQDEKRQKELKKGEQLSLRLMNHEKQDNLRDLRGVGIQSKGNITQKEASLRPKGNSLEEDEVLIIACQGKKQRDNKEAGEKSSKEAEKLTKEDKKGFKETGKASKETGKASEEAKKVSEEAEKPSKEAGRILERADKPVKDAGKTIKEAEKLAKNVGKILKEARRSSEEVEKEPNETIKHLKEAEKPPKQVGNSSKKVEKPSKEVEKSSKEVEKSSNDVEKSSKDTGKPLNQIGMPSKAVEKPSKEAEKPSKATKKLSKVTEKSPKEAEKPKITEKPHKEIKRPSKATEKPSEEAEKLSKPIEKSLKEAERPSKATEKPSKEAEKLSKSTEKPSKEAEKISKAADKPSMESERSSKRSDRSIGFHFHPKKKENTTTTFEDPPEDVLSSSSRDYQPKKTKRKEKEKERRKENKEKGKNKSKALTIIDQCPSNRPKGLNDEHNISLGEEKQANPSHIEEDPINDFVIIISNDNDCDGGDGRGGDGHGDGCDGGSRSSDGRGGDEGCGGRDDGCGSGDGSNHGDGGRGGDGHGRDNGGDSPNASGQSISNKENNWGSSISKLTDESSPNEAECMCIEHPNKLIKEHSSQVDMKDGDKAIKEAKECEQKSKKEKGDKVHDTYERVKAKDMDVETRDMEIEKDILLENQVDSQHEKKGRVESKKRKKKSKSNQTEASRQNIRKTLQNEIIERNKDKEMGNSRDGLITSNGSISGSEQDGKNQHQMKRLKKNINTSKDADSTSE